MYGKLRVNSFENIKNIFFRIKNNFLYIQNCRFVQKMSLNIKNIFLFAK